MINVKVRNLDGLSQKISELPRGVRGEATQAAAKELVGNERHGLQYYPGRKNHGSGNPYQWQSEKQRRAYFATNGFGNGIPSRRTYQLRFGWQVSSWEDGAKTKVINNVPYAKYVQGNQMQNGHKVDGWRGVPEIISSNMAAMMRAVNLAVARYLKNKGLSK